MIPPKQEDDKNVLSGQEDPTENENEAPASDVFATTSPTDGAEVTDTGSEADAPKTRTDGEVKIPKPRLTCKEIKDEDEYFKCPKCDYVNKHPNDIGGRHFKSVHSDTPWDISQVHMFQRPEGGGGHIEYRRQMPNTGNTRNWVAIDSAGNDIPNATNAINDDTVIDAQDGEDINDDNLDTNHQQRTKSRQQLESSFSTQPHKYDLRMRGAPSIVRYGEMNPDDADASTSPSKKRKRNRTTATETGSNGGGNDDESGRRFTRLSLSSPRRPPSMLEIPKALSPTNIPAYLQGRQDGEKIGDERARLQRMYEDENGKKVAAGHLLKITQAKTYIENLETALAAHLSAGQGMKASNDKTSSRIDDEYDQWDVPVYGEDPANSIDLLEGVVEIGIRNIKNNRMTRLEWQMARKIIRAYYRGHEGSRVAIRIMQPIADFFNGDIDLATQSLEEADAVLAAGEVDATGD